MSEPGTVRQWFNEMACEGEDSGEWYVPAREAGLFADAHDAEDARREELLRCGCGDGWIRTRHYHLLRCKRHEHDTCMQCQGVAGHLAAIDALGVRS